MDIYEQFFTCGEIKLYAKHLFSALVQNSTANRFPTNNKSEQVYINFQNFVFNLSMIVRGTLEERVKWLFTFYDLNADARIDKNVIVFITFPVEYENNNAVN